MVEEYLKRGKENARSRQWLRSMTGMPDREVRREIEDMRNRGIFVCNDGDGQGYYISEDAVDLRRQYNKDMAMIAAISKRATLIRKFLKSKGVEV